MCEVDRAQYDSVANEATSHSGNTCNNNCRNKAAIHTYITIVTFQEVLGPVARPHLVM